MVKFSKLFFVSLILILGLSACTDDENTINNESGPDTSSALELLNVSYGTDSDQVYDIYLPANRNISTKTVILVHGGAWTSGDKADMNSIKEAIIEDLPDYAIANINYRLASAGVSPFPMQLNDITSVINDLKAKQDEYVISQEYAFIGSSAGAHLSLLWSYDYDTENNINMAASIVGPTNLTDQAYVNNPDLPINQLMLFFGVTPTTAFLEENSPYHQATVSSPPTILFYGGMDNLIPNSQGEDMHMKLNSLGITNEFTFYPNEGHGWTGNNLFDTWIKMKAFLETYH